MIKVTAQSGPTMQRDALDIAHAALESAGNEETRSDLLNRLTGATGFDAEIDPEFAEKLCREAIAKNPDDVWAHHKLTRIYSVFRKDYAQAESLFRRAIDVDPKFALSWNGLGNVLAETGRKDEAEAAYRKAIELDPNLVSSLNGLGNVLSNIGRNDEAEAAYRKATELDPRFASPWNNLGNLLSNTDRNDEAEAAYRKAIELDSKYAYPHSNLAIMISKDTARRDEARREAIIGLRLGPALELAQDVFRYVCFDHTPSLQSTLPEIGQWYSQRADDLGLVSFLIDAWVALAKLGGPAEAAKLLESQPTEVQLMFEVVSDAFKAHADKDHLHRLAPERRAPVMELLKRLKT
jgi:tetratricopeptide (TPR) repeat protein